GEITNPANAKLADLTLREQLTLAPLVILALWIGLYPKPIFDVIRRPSERIVQAVGGTALEPPALPLKTTAETLPPDGVGAPLAHDVLVPSVGLDAPRAGALPHGGGAPPPRPRGRLRQGEGGFPRVSRDAVGRHHGGARRVRLDAARARDADPRRRLRRGQL